MPLRVLAEDWSDYDNKKLKAVDKNFFSCTEKWEVDYLVSKILKVYPAKSESAIRTAIAFCCNSLRGNQPRKAFVEAVMSKL